MKKFFFSILLLSFFLSCTGEQGPQGPIGNEGPPGATIVYLTGVISSESYGANDYIWISDVSIRHNAVTQVYINEDPDTYTWLAVDFQLADGWICFKDPAGDGYKGWYFLIMIIPDAGG